MKPALLAQKTHPTIKCNRVFVAYAEEDINWVPLSNTIPATRLG
jgi:hypothetical protein